MARNARVGAVTVIGLDKPEEHPAPDVFETAAEEHAKKQSITRCITGLHDKGCLECLQGQGTGEAACPDGSKESSICFDLTRPHPVSVEGYKYAPTMGY